MATNARRADNEAQKDRRNWNQKKREEFRRTKISASRRINALNEIDDCYKDHMRAREEILAYTKRGPLPRSLTKRLLDTDTVAVLKARADLNISLLRKVLPDLKAIEITEDQAFPLIAQAPAGHDAELTPEEWMEKYSPKTH